MSTNTATRRPSISKLVPGQETRLLFKGSKQFGNDPYELDATFEKFSEDGDRAFFKLDGSNPFEAYKLDGLWRYGTSAEVLVRVN